MTIPGNVALIITQDKYIQGQVTQSKDTERKNYTNFNTIYDVLLQMFICCNLYDLKPCMSEILLRWTVSVLVNF